MTEEQQNIAIYILLGLKPNKFWRWFTDKDKIHSEASIPSKKEALRRIEAYKSHWAYTEYTQDYDISEPEEYDDWSGLPSVNLDLLSLAEKNLNRHQKNKYINLLDEKALESMEDEDDNVERDFRWCCSSKENRREALLKTLNLWEE